MPAQIKAPNKMPERLAVLPKDARLNSIEFAKALGLNGGSFKSRVSKNLCGIPDPDFKRWTRGNGRCRGRMPMYQWKAVTVRNYIRKLNRESENE